MDKENCQVRKEREAYIANLEAKVEKLEARVEVLEETLTAINDYLYLNVSLGASPAQKAEAFRTFISKRHKFNDKVLENKMDGLEKS